MLWLLSTTREPEWLSQFEGHVDGILTLEPGATDGFARLRSLGARWALLLDPPDRPTPEFLAALPEAIRAAELDHRSLLGAWTRRPTRGGFLLHGPHTLDHKWLVHELGRTTVPGTKVAAEQRRILDVAIESASGVWAEHAADAEVIDRQAVLAPPREMLTAEERAVARRFAALVGRERGQLGRDGEVLLEWWSAVEPGLSYAAIERLRGRLALVAYGGRRPAFPFAHCTFGQDGEVTAVQEPPGRPLKTALELGTRGLETRAPRPTEKPPLLLSVVMPFFKRLSDFERVLPLNARWFARRDLELVLALDEPSEEAGVVALARRHPELRFRIVVNDFDHPWRAPCRAINVGIRHALGRYVLVVSPESAFVTDVPAIADRLHALGPGLGAIGRVVFATFEELQQLRDLSATYRAGPTPRPYGSLCVERERFERVRGYDEHLEVWGGDDDNIRARLILDGTTLALSEEMKLVHLAAEPRREPIVQRSLGELLDFFQPERAVANPNGWGESFARVAHDWR